MYLLQIVISTCKLSVLIQLKLLFAVHVPIMIESSKTFHCYFVIYKYKQMHCCHRNTVAVEALKKPCCRKYEILNHSKKCCVQWCTMFCCFFWYCIIVLWESGWCYVLTCIGVYNKITFYGNRDAYTTHVALLLFCRACTHVNVCMY